MEGLERVLRGHEFTRGLSDAQTGFLASCAKNVRFDAGETIFREGAAAEMLFLIRQGAVALESHVPGRGAVRLETLGAGDVLGLSWLSEPRRYHLDARAIEPAVALALDASCVRGKIDADHDLGFALAMRLLAETVKRLERTRLQRVDVYGEG